MPFPGSVQLTTVVDTYLDAAGAPCRGTVTFQPGLLAISGVVSVPPVPVYVDLDATGSFSKAIASSVNTGLEPDTTYGIVWVLNGVVSTRTVQIPVSATPVNLSSLIAVVPALSNPLLQLPQFASDPVNPQPGQVYYNTVNGVSKVYDGFTSQWREFGADVGNMLVTTAGLDTGIVYGGTLDASATPLSIDVGAGRGQIVDYVTTPAAPTVTDVVISAQTVAIADTSVAVTWYMADAAGTVTQQTTMPTNTQRRTRIQLGFSTISGGVVIVDQSLPTIIPQPTNQLYDLMDALGAFNISGNRFFAAGTNLQLAKDAGTVFFRGYNHFAGPVLTDDPHVSAVGAQNPIAMQYVTRSSVTVIPTVTSVIPGSYDLGGVITTVGGGTGSSTVQRLFLFPNNTLANQIFVQYGQTVYSTLDAAQAAVGEPTSFVLNPLLNEAVYLGAVALTRVATDLSNAAHARIVLAHKFEGPIRA